jgi:hypothetical protein
MYVAAAGLIPILPTIDVVPVVETPVFAKITKLPAVPRFTVAGDGCDMTVAGVINAIENIIAKKRFHPSVIYFL